MNTSRRIDANRVRSSEMSYRAPSLVSRGKDYFTTDLRSGDMRKRIFWVFSLAGLLLVALGLRVAFLQTVFASSYSEGSV